jgi:hypothetical protein
VPRNIRLNRLIPYLLAPLIGALFCLDGLSGVPFFQALRFAPLHRLEMRMRLFVVLAARAAEKEQNRLSVSAHALSFRIWRVVVKRSTIARNV